MGWKTYDLTISKPRDMKAWQRTEDLAWLRRYSNLDESPQEHTTQVKRKSEGKYSVQKRAYAILPYLTDEWLSVSDIIVKNNLSNHPLSTNITNLNTSWLEALHYLFNTNQANRKQITHHSTYFFKKL